MTSASLPAILGGTPVRTRPYPFPNFIGKEERTLVDQVLDSGVLSAYIAHDGPWFEGGPMVKAFEAECCRVLGSRFAVSVNSAASGLHASVAAALAGPGDEVIVPPYTMSATATAVTSAGATPVFADIRPDTFCIDIEDVKKKLSSRTRAIIAVNLFGGPAALDELRSLSDSQNILLVEDNAQAPGASLNGRPTGTWGHMGVFSFNCHKTIQSGEGGVVLTDDATLADRLRLVRNHGEVVLAQRKHVPEELYGLLGHNYRLTELQAAIALAQLRKLEEFTAPRIEMAGVLTKGLAGIPGVTPPFVANRVRHVYYAYAIRIDAASFGLSRQQFKNALDAEGVMSAEGYVKPIYLYPMYDARVARQRQGYGAGLWHPPAESGVHYTRGICPVTERMYFEELLSTSICRADLSREDAHEFVRAVEKIHEHRIAIRSKLTSAG